MENQNIEKTRCCHRLYELLVRSTDQSLVGEPWFRFVAGGLYFSSRTKTEMVANLLIGKRDELNALRIDPHLEIKVYGPFIDHISTEDFRLRVMTITKKQKDVMLCRELGDFFRLHYQKLG